jgi:hypothetical protein
MDVCSKHTHVRERGEKAKANGVNEVSGLLSLYRREGDEVGPLRAPHAPLALHRVRVWGHHPPWAVGPPFPLGGLVGPLMGCPISAYLEIYLFF